MRIATGEEAADLQDDGKNAAARELGSKGGKKRAEIAKKARKAGRKRENQLT